MRIQLLNENSLVRRILTLEKLRDALKAVGQRFGSDSVKVWRIYSAASYDIQVNNVQFNNRIVEVTFTPDNPNDPNTSLVYKMVLQYMPSSSDNNSFDDDTQIERLKPVNGVQKWRLYLSGSDYYPTAWVQFKFYFYASGNGTFTAQLI